MKLVLRFLLILRKLISIFRHRWDQSTRRLWYIFRLVRSRILFQPPKKAEIRQTVDYRPPKSPTTVICTSRFLPPSIPVVGGDTQITSPIPISIQVPQPRTLNPEDTIYETHENYSRERLGIDPEGGSPVLGSSGSAAYWHEPEPIHAILPSHQEDHASPVTPPRSPSQYSYRSASQYSIYRSLSYDPHHSPPNLNGAEAAARQYLDGSQSPRCSSPVASVHPPSVKAFRASQVYRASRPISQVRRLPPMRNTLRRRVVFSTPAPTHQSIHNVPPELLRPESRTSGSIHRDRPGMAVDLGPVLPASPRDRLRPMIGIDRYEKEVVIEDILHTHVSPPVTTEYVR